jgi:hypothetical protein
MSSRDALPGRGWLHRRLPTFKVPKRARIYPDDLQMEFLEDNASPDLQQSTRAPFSVESSSIFHSLDTNADHFDAFWGSLVSIIMPMITACRYNIGQRFASVTDSARLFSAHGRHMFQTLGVVYQVLCFRTINSYLGLLQMVLDVEKALNEKYSTKMYQSHRNLSQGFSSLSKNGNQILPYNKLVAQPPYLESLQCCFICLDLGEDDAKAVQIRIKRPTKYRRIKTWATGSSGNLKSICYKDIQRCDWAVESDADVYHKIRRTSLSAYGAWYRFLPFYGIKSVQEVEVRLTSPITLYLFTDWRHSLTFVGESITMALFQL